MGARRCSDLISGQHPRQLDFAVLAVEREDPRHRAVTEPDLLDLEMTIRRSRDLRQMGDGQDLIGGGEIGQQPGEGRSRRPTETGIDLVEEQGHGASGARRPEHRSDGEVDSRELTPRGDASHGSRFLTGIGGDEQLTLLDPAGIEGNAAAIPHQGAAFVDPRLPAELHVGSSHAESGEHFFNRPRESSSGFPSSFVESIGGGVKVAESGGSRRRGGPEPVFDLFELFLFRHQRRPVFEDPSEGITVFEHELVEAVEPALDAIEDTGTVVHISGQGPHLANQLLDVDPCFRQGR